MLGGAIVNCVHMCKAISSHVRELDSVKARAFRVYVSVCMQVASLCRLDTVGELPPPTGGQTGSKGLPR